MGISGDALTLFAGWEHVQTQIHDSDVLMMRMCGEQIQHVCCFFLLPSNHPTLVIHLQETIGVRVRSLESLRET